MTKVDINVHRIVTRFTNVIPTFTAISLGLQPLSLLVYSQVVLSVMITLLMVPLLYHTSKKKFMGEFVNRWPTITALVCAGTIVSLNAHLLLTL